MAYRSHPFQYGGISSAFTDKDADPLARLVRKLGITLRASRDYDLFHFHFAESLLPRNLDLMALRALRKPVVMHFWGSDIRIAKTAVKHNEWATECLSTGDDNRKRRHLRRLARWVSAAVVADHELSEYIDGTFNRVEIIRQAMTDDPFLRRYAPGVFEPLFLKGCGSTHTPRQSWPTCSLSTSHSRPAGISERRNVAQFLIPDPYPESCR